MFSLQISTNAASQVDTTATQMQPALIQTAASHVVATRATQARESHAQISMNAPLKDITAMPMPPVQTMMATLCALAMMDTVEMVSPALISTNALPVI